MLSRQTYLNEIVEIISILQVELSNKNKINLNDGNIIIEDFVCGLLNLCYEYKLVNLNEEKQNYPGIDIGDNISKIGFQITSDIRSSKVDETIEKCLKYKCYTKYPKLKFFMLQQKQSSYTLHKEYSDKIFFDKKKDIYDFNDVIKKISHMDIDKIKAVYDYFSKESNVLVDNKISLKIMAVEQNKASMVGTLFEYNPEECERLMEAYYEALKMSQDNAEIPLIETNIAYKIPDDKYEKIHDYFNRSLPHIEINRNMFSLTEELMCPFEENINFMYQTIIYYETLEALTNIFNKVYSISLYLYNNGACSLDNIEVELTISSNAQILVFDELNFEGLGCREIEYIATRLFEKSILQETADIKAYDMDTHLIKYNTYRESIENASRIFNYRLIKGKNNKDVIKFSFKSINVEQKVWFPTKLFIITEKAFTINYKMTSRQHTKTHAGIIEFSI